MHPSTIYCTEMPGAPAAALVAGSGASSGVDGRWMVMSDPARQPKHAQHEPHAVTGEAVSLTTPAPAATATSIEELTLLAALRAGDEAAFETLVNLHYAAMLRVALLYVRNRAVAEEVVQETWLAVLQGLDRFEGRSTLKTWIFRILANRARTRAEREGRSVPFSALAQAETEGDEPAVEPERFQPADGRYPGHWAAAPASWEGMPEERLLSGETRERLRATIQALPSAQRAVITLRDVEGWTPEEVSAHLGVTDGNQRVLLHRARSKVRAALERYLAEV